MKISPHQITNKTKDIVEDFIRLRIKSGEKWYSYSVKYKADKRELTNLQDLANEIAFYRERKEAYPFELKQRIESDLGDTAKRDLFVKAKVVEPIEKRDTSIAGVMQILKERLNKRLEKKEIEAGVKFKRDNVINKFKEYCDKKLPHVNDIRDIRHSHCIGFMDYIRYDRKVAGKERTVANTTAASEKKWLSQLFDYLVKVEYLKSNPFSGITVKTTKSDERLVTVPYIILEGIEVGLQSKAIQDEKYSGWYIYWMLTRWLGSRKNEALQLQWKDVEFNAMNGMGALNMPAPKTKKKTGNSTRRCPLMNGTSWRFVDCDLRQALVDEKKRQKAQPTDYVVQGILNLPKSKRDQVVWKNKNVSTTLEKLIIEVGFSPWVKLVQNLRSTRANELTKYSGWRPEAIHAIIGHSRDTYLRSYANVTDDDFTAPLEPSYDDTYLDPETGLTSSPNYSPYFTTTGRQFLDQRLRRVAENEQMTAKQVTEKK